MRARFVRPLVAFARMTFVSEGGERRIFEVCGHVVDPAPDEELKAEENP
jgi:hypothetical protein